MPIINYTSKQYSGIWNISKVTNNLANNTWPTQQASLYDWGNNNYGQLGLNSTVSYSSPKQVGALTNWLSISSGPYNRLAIKTDGTLWAWGQNQYGCLGFGNSGSITYYSSPKQVGTSSNWKQAVIATEHSAAIKNDGTLWTWGQNQQGQLGLNNTVYFYVPTQVGGLSNWSTAAVLYGGTTLAIKTDGTLWGWGYNGNGQLGLNNTNNYSSPVQIGSLTNWKMLANGPQYMLAIKTDGTLWAWGNNNYDQLGLGNRTNYSSPKQVGVLTNWKSVISGAYQNTIFAIKTDGTLWSWGYNNAQGVLGIGVINTNYSSPVQVGALTNWATVSSGGGHAAAIKTDGTLWAWGRNLYGCLGLGNATNYSSPKQVGTLTNWLSISCGYASNAARQFVGYQ